MMDAIHTEIDKQIAEMDVHIAEIYSKAGQEIAKKSGEYFSKFIQLDDKKQKLVKEGKLTEKEYQSWQMNKLMYGQHWLDLKADLSEKYLHSNEVATAYINGKLPKAYAVSYNGTNAQIGQVAKGYSFELVNENTVKHLATKDETLLPYKIVDGKKDIAWNTKKINSEVLQGILQGESIPKIASRLQNVTNMNKNSALRNARTSMTSAENKGRMDGYENAKKQGIIVHKIWVSAHDDRTRAWHSDLDGVEKEIDESFENDYGKIMYPGDPEADPANVYNCRCALRTKVIGFVKKVKEEAHETVEVKKKEYMTVKKLQTKVDDLDIQIAELQAKVDNGIANSIDLQKLDVFKSEKEKYQEQLDKKLAKKENKAIKKAQKNLDSAQSQLDALENKTYSGIWKDDVSLEDYNLKKDSIANKKLYYESALDNGKITLEQYNDYIDKLDEFETLGQNYAKAMQAVSDAKSELNKLTVKGQGGLYTQERKDNARWFTRKTYNQGDEYYTRTMSDVHKLATSDEINAYYDYTSSSGAFNRPLAGFDARKSSYGEGWSESSYVGMGKVSLNSEGKGKQIQDLTTFIAKSKTKDDIWIQTSQSFATLEGENGFLGISYGTLSQMSDRQLQRFVGETAEFGQFISGAINRGGGSYNPGDMRLNIFIPQESEALYVLENGAFGKNEHEIILQRGGTYQIKKIYWGQDVETGGRKLFVDMDLLSEYGYDKFGM